MEGMSAEAVELLVVKAIETAAEKILLRVEMQTAQLSRRVDALWTEHTQREGLKIWLRLLLGSGWLGFAAVLLKHFMRW